MLISWIIYIVFAVITGTDCRGLIAIEPGHIRFYINLIAVYAELFQIPKHVDF